MAGRLPTVLVVDPHPDMRELYRTILAPMANVLEAEDGADALIKIASNPPNLMITETRLRRFDGFALCAFLRADPANHTTKIMVVTSEAYPSDTERALRAGADEVLVKPCAPDDVVAAAQRLLPRANGTVRKNPVDIVATEAPAKRRPRSRTFQRVNTTTPPVPPPQLHCPVCDTLLVYQQSYIGGVSERSAEQWDDFTCRNCGPYQYRQRTRKLKPA